MEEKKEALIKKLYSQGVTTVLDRSFDLRTYMPINLSVNNHELARVDMSSPEGIQEYINNKLEQNNKSVAYGGYLEQRDLYSRSKHFTEDARNIHLGIDLWCGAGTEVLAAMDGHIHSFQNNNNYGDYGPTIILEHKLGSETYYTLYGHLNLDSIKNIKKGQSVLKHEPIAQLGTSEVNGDYAPHLHFQLILDLEGNQGDYPGVCAEKDLNWYKANCPDPIPLLGLT